MKDWEAIRSRYLQDPVPYRLGGLAADLARVASFAENAANHSAVAGMLEESKWFIEWTVLEARPEVQEELLDLQLQLAFWHLDWPHIYASEARVKPIREAAARWSERIIAISGLLDEAPR